MGRTPWSAADAPSALIGNSAEPDRGSGADEGVRPTVSSVGDARLKPTLLRLLSYGNSQCEAVPALLPDLQ
jgi:hypothetical protein